MGKKTDVDVDQKNVSPQVKVEQGAPDGKGGSNKDADTPEDKTKAKGDEEGDEKDKKKQDKDDPDEKEDADEDEDKEKAKKDKKKDSDASPTDKLKKDIADAEEELKSMKAKKDAMEAKLDEYASKSFGKEEKKDRTDSADYRSAVQRRVKLERRAEKMVPDEIAARFDSLTDHEIMSAVIQHVRPNADLKGKSKDYLESRFDTIAEDMEQGSEIRKEMGEKFFRHAHNDSAESNPAQSRLKAINTSRDEWKQPLSAVKK